MPSEKKTAANRANAAKSTGPKTTEGKARSSANALKWGFFSQKPFLLGEDPSVYQAWISQLTEVFKPDNVVAEILIYQIANDTLRLLRLDKAEGAFLMQFNTRIAERARGAQNSMEHTLGHFIHAWRNMRKALSQGDITAALKLLEPLEKAEENLLKANEHERPSHEAQVALAGFTHGGENRKTYEIIDELRRRIRKDILRSYAALEAMKERRSTTAGPTSKVA